MVVPKVNQMLHTLRERGVEGRTSLLFFARLEDKSGSRYQRDVHKTPLLTSSHACARSFASVAFQISLSICRGLHRHLRVLLRCGSSALFVSGGCRRAHLS